MNCIEIVYFLDKEKRLSKPTACPKTFYKLWKRCWLKDSQLRPTFAHIIRQLDEFLENAEKASFLKQLQTDHMYQNLISNISRSSRESDPEANVSHMKHFGDKKTSCTLM